MITEDHFKVSLPDYPIWLNTEDADYQARYMRLSTDNDDEYYDEYYDSDLGVLIYHDGFWTHHQGLVFQFSVDQQKLCYRKAILTPEDTKRWDQFHMNSNGENDWQDLPVPQAANPWSFDLDVLLMCELL